MTTWLIVAVTFGLVIFIHELGHFLVARKLGVKVEKFSLGLGRKFLAGLEEIPLLPGRFSFGRICKNGRGRYRGS